MKPALYCSLADESGAYAKQLSPVDTRALSWMAFGRCCLDTELHVGSRPLSWDAAGFAAVATALARQPPRAAALDGLHVQVPVSQFSSLARQPSCSVSLLAVPRVRPEANLTQKVLILAFWRSRSTKNDVLLLIAFTLQK